MVSLLAFSLYWSLLSSLLSLNTFSGFYLLYDITRLATRIGGVLSLA